MSEIDAARPEPIPTGEGIDVGGMAATLARDAGHARVAEDLESRIAFGERKYGTRLRTHNGRNALMDTYQEALDGSQYAMQCHLEGSDDGTLYWAFIRLAAAIRERLAE